MHNRKAIFFLLFIFSILIYSRLSAGDPTSLPNARDINGNGLANIPPVNDAIDVFQNRLKQNPNDAVSYTLLGGLYLRQARETGDATGYQRAEAALKKSLELLPGYSPAGSALASSYYSQHNFDQALELANRVYESNPKDKSALVTVADAQLALGKYAEAEKIYTDLANTDVTPPLLARIASLEELKGEPEHAIDLMSRAAAQAGRR